MTLADMFLASSYCELPRMTLPTFRRACGARPRARWHDAHLTMSTASP
jgi:hypothetical protein